MRQGSGPNGKVRDQAENRCLSIGRFAAHGLSMKPMNTFAAGAHIQAKIASLPLKEMEASLLRTAILSHIAHSYRLDIDGEYILAQVETAIDIASYAHRSQTRQNRGEMPKVHYVEHPLRNALRALRYGVTSDPATIIAIILHDVVEDCAAIVAVELCDAPLGLGEEAYRRIVHFYFLRTYGSSTSISFGHSEPRLCVSSARSLIR